MNELQQKALQQAIHDIEKAEHIMCIKAGKPDFGSAQDRLSHANEVYELLKSAREWVAAATKNG